MALTQTLADLLALLEDFRRAMLSQTLIKKLDRLSVLLLLEVGVPDPGVHPAAEQRRINQRAHTHTHTSQCCSGAEHLLGDLSVIFAVLSSHLDGLLTQLSALLKLTLFKAHS